MKKMLYVLFFAFVMFFFVDNAYAACSKDELKELQDLARSIRIEYQENDNPTKEDFAVEPAYDENGKLIPDEDEEEFTLPKATIDVIVSGYSDKFYIVDEEYGYRFDNSKIEDGMLVLKNQSAGRKKYSLYASSCGSLVKTLSITLPKYNRYSEDPLCEGISGDDLSVCRTWYDYDMDYTTFKQRVEKYKADLVELEKKKKKREIEKKFEDIKEFFEDYYLYMIAVLLVVVAIIVYVFVQKKRSVLE